MMQNLRKMDQTIEKTATKLEKNAQKSDAEVQELVDHSIETKTEYLNQ